MTDFSVRLLGYVGVVFRLLKRTGLTFPPDQVPLQPRVSSPTLGVVEAIPDLRALKADLLAVLGQARVLHQRQFGSREKPPRST
jgi:hypothetical protein